MNSRPLIPLMILLCVLCSADAVAQKYGVSLSGGFHHGTNARDEHDAPFASTRSYSLGSGSTRHLQFHYFPDSSNWYLSAGLQHFISNGTITAYAGNFGQNNDMAQHVRVNAYRLTSHLAYGFQFKSFDIRLHAGVVLPFAGKVREDTWVNDTWGHSKTSAELTNYITAGFSGGVSCNVHLSKTAGFFIHADFMRMNSRVKRRSIQAYEDTRGITLETQYPHEGDRNFEYRKQVAEVRNNRDVLPALYNRNQPTDKLTYTQSYSSAGLQFGFMFIF